MTAVPRLVIVADDLTGAADSAAALAPAEPTSVVLDAAAGWPSTGVVAVDTDSRHEDPHVAGDRVAAAAGRALDLGSQVFKKIDSTLRGNVAAEISAAAEAFRARVGKPLVVLAPAFPATGRTTVNGVVHVHGDRLEAHGQDGDLVALLARRGLTSSTLGVSVAAEPRRLSAELRAARARDVDVVVVDGRTDEHLRSVTEASRHVEGPVLLVGSGGLARTLSEQPQRAATPTPLPDGQSGSKPALVVVGSYADEALAQRLSLVRNGVTEVWLGDEPATVSRLRRALARGPVVLSPDPGAPVVRTEAHLVAPCLARVARAVLADAGALVATGGETARAILTAAGVGHLQVLGEPEPGVVHLHASSLQVDVITKAGAFGDPETLLRCLSISSHNPNPEGATAP